MPLAREILSSNESLESSRSSVSQEKNDSTRHWQRGLAEAVRDLPTLLARLQLSITDFPNDVLPLSPGEEEFPVLVPESYLKRIRPGDVSDPLLLQVLPVSAERDVVPGFQTDPVGDESARVAPGLLHKYRGRALMIAHGSCAVHCRYCFRRHFPYAIEPQSSDAWEPALTAIRNDQSLHEIILSGGDPLILSDRRLQQLLASLAEIPHLRRVRIHSRLPIVLPERMTPELLTILTSTRLRVWFVIHSNHARELMSDCADAVGKLIASGIPVLNQAVLLRGVNDSLAALEDLCERCIDLGVTPYYLHQLDRVQGAAHFEVPDAVGLQLIEELRSRLPGFAVPRFVREDAGALAKTPLFPLENHADGNARP